MKTRKKANHVRKSYFSNVVKNKSCTAIAKKRKRPLFVITEFIIFFALLAAKSVLALPPPDKFPRIGNYFLKSGTDITTEITSLLSRYDLLVLPSEAQVQNPNLFNELRRQNSDIIILAYVPTLSWNNVWTDSLHQKLGQGIRTDWWLKDASGNQISVWQNTKALNLTGGWANYLAQFTYNEILSTGLWDGIFYDEVDPCIICRNQNVDLDNNSQADIQVTADINWRQGYINLLNQSRELSGDRKIFIINGSSTTEYQPYINGRMFESFPTPWEGLGRWEDTMRNYSRLEQTVGGHPTVFFIDGDTNNTGQNNNFQDVRFGLTSTLLGGGFFGYDFGTESHGQLWWYDEYGVYLGSPVTAPININSPQNSTLTPSIWRRDFEKGIVVLNSTNQTQEVSLGSDFEKIHGTQDASLNDGSIISDVALPPYDGVVLLRISDRVLNTAFPNGAFSRVFNSTGQVKRTGFFLYDARFRGGDEVLLTDLDNNDSIEALVAKDGRVEIWQQDNSKKVFAPYGDQYKGDIKIAVGDTNGDDSREIITAAGQGGGPHVRIFSGNGRALGPGFFAYDQNFRGGVEVATGDLDGNGKDEIITGIASAGIPQIKVFHADGAIVNNGFLAYDARFRGGANIATGDTDGNDTIEIVSGAGRGGGPHVRIFNANGVPQGKGFFAYNASRRDGVRVALADIDGDGKDEILAITTELSP